MFADTKILVTGGSGFIGSHLVRKLVSLGAAVTVVGRSVSSDALRSGVVFYKADLAQDDLEFARNFHYIFHLAALSSPHVSHDLHEAISVNFQATARLLSAVSTSSVLKKFVFPSTSLLYAGDGVSLLQETAPINPYSHPYVLAKNFSEQVCTYYSRVTKMPIVILRLSNIYGPAPNMERMATLVPELITKAFTQRAVEIRNGTPVRDWLYVEDAVDALVAAASVTEAVGIYNVSSATGVSAGAIGRIIADECCVPFSDLGKETRPPYHIVCDNTKFRRVTGWAPKVGIQDGIKKTIETYRRCASMEKTALITGITGQDGSYLAEFLLSKGYKVVGLVRRSSTLNRERIDHLYFDPSKSKNFELVYGDLMDAASLNMIFRKYQFDEVYNLGAQSHVQISFETPEYTADSIALGTLRLLEVMRHLDKVPKFYQASSSEMFGKCVETPQVETTPFYPRSPYGVSKVFGYWITKNYRESYNLFACNGILFNHESPRRGENFVTRKITLGVCRIMAGLQDTLRLGNLDAKRDWGYAGDYVEAMWLMLQYDKPDDYVISTGETHSVREFVELAFKEFGVQIQWRGSGVDEVGYDSISGKVLVKVDPKFFRKAEVDLLLGDSTKACKVIGWRPRVTFSALVRMMVDSDRKKVQNELAIRGANG